MNMKETTVLQRLRAADLRPTVARIGILQVIGAMAPQAVCADEVFRRMMLCGTRTSMGTIYRGIQQLQSHGLLLREWTEDRKAMYRLKLPDHAVKPLRLVCRESGRTMVLHDEALQVYLMAMAEREGLDIADEGFAIHVDRLGTALPVVAGHRGFSGRLAD